MDAQQRLEISVPRDVIAGPMAEAILQNLILLTFWYNPMRDFGTPILEAHATIFP